MRQHFPGPSAPLQGRGQAQPRCGLLLPGQTAKRLTTVDALPERLQLLGGERCIDPLHPRLWAGNWPGAQQPLGYGTPLFPLPEAPPAPALCLCYQPSAPRITLYVTTDGEEMLVSLDREGFAAALVQVPCPGRVVVRMPTLRGREGSPPNTT